MCIPIYMLTYGRPEYLFATLDSLDKMTVYPNIVIIGNKGDDTRLNKIYLKFADRGMKSIFRTTSSWTGDFREDRDLTIQANPSDDGLNDSEYMVIMDDDVLVPHYWLSQLVGLMTKYKEFGILTTNLSDVDLPDPNNPLTPKRKRNEMIWADQEIYDGELNEIETTSGLVIIRTEIYKKIGEFYRDQWFSEQVQKQGYKVGIAKHIFARHLGQNYFYDYPNYINAGNSIK